MVQAAIGLVSGSPTVYLATPVVANAVWAAAFLASAAIGRPLAGMLACAWYPFQPAFRESARFKRVYGIESVVWGVYLLLRSALRLFALLHGGVGGFVVVTALTGTPVMTYLQRHGTRRVPQWLPLPGQVRNSTGGHAWEVGIWERLRRFLILGTEGGSYYASEWTLTREAAVSVDA